MFQSGWIKLGECYCACSACLHNNRAFVSEALTSQNLRYWPNQIRVCMGKNKMAPKFKCYAYFGGLFIPCYDNLERNILETI